MALVLVIGLLIALYALNCANKEIDHLRITDEEMKTLNRSLDRSHDYPDDFAALLGLIERHEERP